MKCYLQLKEKDKYIRLQDYIYVKIEDKDAKGVIMNMFRVSKIWSY